jgi:hypothetical protein
VIQPEERDIRTALVATALAGGLLSLGGVAQAEEKLPEQTIKSECKAAGGTYSTGVSSKGNRGSTCTYKDNSGNGYMDIFRNGKYLGTF